jgi:hypothetical protein
MLSVVVVVCSLDGSRISDGIASDSEFINKIDSLILGLSFVVTDLGMDVQLEAVLGELERLAISSP